MIKKAEGDELIEELTAESMSKSKKVWGCVGICVGIVVVAVFILALKPERNLFLTDQNVSEELKGEG